MSSLSTPSTNQNGAPSRGIWASLAPYAVPPLAASVAIFPAYDLLRQKSEQQLGNSISKNTILEKLRGASKVAPTVGAIIGSQMIFHKILEKSLSDDGNKASLTSTLASSAAVGIASAPLLAVFNGQTMGMSAKNSLRKLSIKQGGAITAQETSFVAGLSAADRVSDLMKEKFGDNKAVEYGAAFTSGALGSLAGHPANTALTRWQKGLTVDSFSQSMRGATRKAAAIGIFAAGYKFGKENLNSTT